MAITPSAPQVGKKPFGVTNLAGGKSRGKPEVDLPEVLRHIELLGVRLAWSRASICPCTQINDQTNQPAPDCPKCQGLGFFWFGPKDYSPPAEAGTLNTVQQAILADDGAAVIRGLFTRARAVTDPYDVLGTWTRGHIWLSVRPENKLGYYDRIVNLDSEICFTENIEIDLDDATAFVDPIKLKYRATCVNTIQSVTDRYEQDVDFELTTGGDIQWLGTPPTADADALACDKNTVRLAVHYNTYPTWIVTDHPHVIRETQTRRKIKEPTSPFGNSTPLPLQAFLRLEFLPNTSRDRPFDGS